MKKEMLGSCPVCSEALQVTELTCPRCQTVISGNFTTCSFCRLDDRDKYFIETFIRCRGNIKEVEKELGISYPTVRSRLEKVSQRLGYTGERDEKPGKREALERLEADEITVEEALKIIRGDERDD